MTSQVWVDAPPKAFTKSKETVVYAFVVVDSEESFQKLIGLKTILVDDREILLEKCSEDYFRNRNETNKKYKQQQEKEQETTSKKEKDKSTQNVDGDQQSKR